MIKAKKIYVVTLFLALAAALAVFCFVLVNSGKSGENAVSQASHLIKTEERNFSGGSASFVTLQQNDLFHSTDTIFSGTYTRSENYTFVYHEDGEQ